jgi:hypothetical protein
MQKPIKPKICVKSELENKKLTQLMFNRSKFIPHNMRKSKHFWPENPIFLRTKNYEKQFKSHVIYQRNQTIIKMKFRNQCQIIRTKYDKSKFKMLIFHVKHAVKKYPKKYAKNDISFMIFFLDINVFQFILLNYLFGKFLPIFWVFFFPEDLFAF